MQSIPVPAGNSTREVVSNAVYNLQSLQLKSWRLPPSVRRPRATSAYFVVSISHHTERCHNRSDDSGRFLLFTCAESCIDRAEATNSCTVRKLRASSRLCADVVCHGRSGAVYGRQQWLRSLHFVGTWIVPLQESCNSRDAPTQYRKVI